ncbi:MAG: glycosyltransferase family 39 protein [Opitutae bacterium]|nr:glycosyltransferase family 39 protein [Opitutae bacterium]
MFIALLHALIGVRATVGKSMGADEMAHVVGGYTFNHWNDYRLHPENGILPQRWQALPATLARIAYPPLQTPYWHESDVWMIGHACFYELGNDLDWLLQSARAMNAVFGAGTVLLVSWWARRLFGWAGALTAATFCALCPTMLAHTALATSDMAMSFFLLASGTAYWMHLHDGRARMWWLSAGVFGLACVAKYTAVLLLPLFALLALWRVFRSEPLFWLGRTATTRWARLWVVLASTLGHGLVATTIIWAFFGFRYSAMNPALPGGEFSIPWVAILYGGGWKADVVQFCRDWRLLPEGFLYGFAFVLKHAGQRGAFLDGDYSIYGWVEFFPKAFLYKTPPSLLVSLAVSMLFVGLHSLGRSRQLLQRLYDFAPVALMFLLYWAVSLPSHLNIGHRHILPTYPLLFILTGALGWATVRSWQKSGSAGLILGTLSCLLLGWQAYTAARIHPHYLAYFSPAAGGPEQGYRHLVDSSLDWGQDLPGLKVWLDQNRRPGENLYLSYFGTGEPSYYGIEAIRMPTLHNFKHATPWYWPGPGLYAISATMLQHVYSGIRGPWTAELEHRYQMLRVNNANFRLIQTRAPGYEQLLASTSQQEWETAWRLYEELRFARLCHYLSARPPDAQIGFSIMVYRLRPEELTLALDEPASNLVRAIGRMSGPDGIKP